MNVIRKEWEQWIPRPLDEVWQFFSRPENLNEITPDDMTFKILTNVSREEMYEGMIIQYRVSPVRGIGMNWVTEITHLREREYFIDEQRFGPYAFWHHQHRFEERDGGVLMRDILHYKVPFSFIGSVVNALFVESRVEAIFTYRLEAVERIFGFKSSPFSIDPAGKAG